MIKREIASSTTIVLFLLFILLFQAPKNVFAGSNASGDLPKDAKISGIIKDGSNNETIPYASVAIYSSKDSTLMTGTLSKDDGSFIVDKLPYGKFYAVITFVGYKKHIVNNIMLSSAQKTAVLGVVKVNASSTALKVVEVVGNPPSVTYQIDKKVINIAQNITATGGSLAEALKNAPSIQSDAEGNVTLRGNSNFTVLIDGRPSPLKGSEALLQMPANLVQNVEIMTNPSAKYEAEGTAGILNIVTKKQKVQGLNTLLNVTWGTGEKYGANLNLNYKISKFNFTLGADIKDDQAPFKITGINSDTLSQQLLKKQTIIGSGNLHRYGRTLNLGIDYAINDKNSLILTAATGDRAFPRPIYSTYKDQYIQNANPTPTNIYYLNSTNPEFKRSYKSFNLDWQLKFNKKGEQLSVSTYYNGGPSNNLNTLRVDTTDINWISTGKTALQRSIQNNDLSDFRTKADYVLPIGAKSKLEAGYMGTYATSNGEDYVSNFTGGAWIEDLSRRDKVSFSDQIQAGYATFLGSSPIFDYQIGLRTEYENRNLNQEILNKDFKVKRLDFFPSIHLTKNLPFKLQLQANYTRRINRPYQALLNPFVVQLDPQTTRQGNPGLLPEFANSFELNLEKKLTDASFISIDGFLRQTSDLLQQISIFDQATQVTTNTMSNIDHNRSLGAECMVYLEPVKWFSLNSSFNVFNYHLFGTPVTSAANSVNTWNFHFNPTFNVSSQTHIQLSYIYNAPTITAQGIRSGFYSSTLALKQSVLKNKGSLTLQLRNLLGPIDYSTITNSPHQFKYSNFRLESQVLMLTFSYRISRQTTRQNNKQNQGSQNNNSEPDIDVMGF